MIDGDPTAHLLSPNESSWARNGLHLVSSWPKRPMITTKPPRLLLRLLLDLHKLTKRPYFGRQNLYNSLKTEKSSWYLPEPIPQGTSIHSTER